MSLRLVLDAILFAGILLFGIGVFWKDRRAHLARAGAWGLFGVFWFAQLPTFLDSGDPVNSLGAAAALPVFLFIAYHENLSYRWDEEYQPLRFLATGAFWAAGIYFLIDRIPALSGGLISVVAGNTTSLLNSGGTGFAVGAVNYVGNPLGWRPSHARRCAPSPAGGHA